MAARQGGASSSRMAAVLALAALGPRTPPVDLGTLSPPHSDQGDNNNTSTSHNNNNSSQGVDKPMDLSSGGGMFTEVAGPQHGGHPLLSARRLADLVRAQHRQSEAAASRLLGDKRKWEEEEEETSGPEAGGGAPEQGRGAGADLGRERGASPGLGPGSPAGSSTSSGSEGGGGGREEKRRRLDLLLNKKFDRIHSQQQQEPLVSTPPPSERETSPASDSRRPSTDSCAGEPRPKHRRKQSRGQGSVSSSRPGSRPGSPLPNISIRPHSDLFPPVATSTPRAAAKTKPAAAKQSGEEKENKDALKQQLLQVSAIKLLV